MKTLHLNAAMRHLLKRFLTTIVTADSRSIEVCNMAYISAGLQGAALLTICEEKHIQPQQYCLYKMFCLKNILVAVVTGFPKNVVPLLYVKNVIKYNIM